MLGFIDDKMNQKCFYIGYANDGNLRYKASSGGIGSALIKYLLENRKYGTSMTFVFNKDECRYEPKLIYDFVDYNNCGSIYQDTDTIGFIKNNINNIQNGIVITCMPCQVRAINRLLGRNNIKHFIISLCCSGQTTVQGTWYYYKLLGIRREDVCYIQYRGNGWPSGIQIELKNGEVVKKDNYTYPWTLMHKSLLFRPKRCLSCTMKTSPDAEVSLADPWLREYIKNDKVGNTVIICNEAGNNIVKEMADNALLSLKEVDENTYVQSQLGTIQIKSKANQYKRYNKIIGRMGEDGAFYKNVFTKNSWMMKAHLKIIRFLQMILNR